VEGMDFLHMSRDDERQADLLGTNILYSAGYDPRGLAQIFEIIQTKVDSSGSEWFSDHPNPGNRTQYVMDEISTLPPRQNPVVTTAAFKQAKGLAQSARTFTAQETKAGAWKRGNYAAGPGPNAGTVASVADTTGRSSAGTMGTINTGGSPTGGGGSARYLGDAVLGLDAGLATYRGPGFAMDVPGNWSAQQTQDGGVTIAPAGGAGGFGIAYGAMVGLAKTGSAAQLDSNSLLNATRQLAQRYTSDGTMQQIGDVQPVNVSGQRGYGVELRGQSPVVDAGRNAGEHDWLVTTARPDGGVGYVVFVSPERDWAKLRPMFREMAGSFRPVELQ
jgi:hypothetical protein